MYLLYVLLPSGKFKYVCRTENHRRPNKEFAQYRKEFRWYGVNFQVRDAAGVIVEKSYYPGPGADRSKLYK